MAASSNVSTHSFRSAVSDAASSPTTASYHDTNSNWDQQSSQRSHHEDSSRRSSASADTLRPTANNQPDESGETNTAKDSEPAKNHEHSAIKIQEPIKTTSEDARRTIVASNTPEILAEKPSSVRSPSSSSSEVSNPDRTSSPAQEKTEERRIEPIRIPSEQSPPHSKNSGDEKISSHSNETTLKKTDFMGPFPDTPLPTACDPFHPPPINYSLRPRICYLLFFWAFVFVDTIAVPIVLFFCLTRLAPSLSRNAVFSISTGCLGGTSILEYFLRFWRLYKKSSNCRVIGAAEHRWYLDWFHWNFSVSWIFVMFELIIGTAFTRPPIRLLAMPVSTMLFWFAIQLLLLDTLRLAGCNTPVRISSVPKGAPMRPGIYSIIEDVIAVDGSGGTRFREELNARFLASRDFRSMLHRLSVFWALGSGFAATLTTILVFVCHKQVGYTIGWSLPFVWAAIWSLISWIWVHYGLKREKKRWIVKMQAKSQAHV